MMGDGIPIRPLLSIDCYQCNHIILPKWVFVNSIEMGRKPHEKVEISVKIKGYFAEKQGIRKNDGPY
jgi:hypothetical protein